MINNVTLVGRLANDIELRNTPSVVASAKFRLAVKRPFKNQQNEPQADFINVQVWRKQAENAANYLKKGSLCGIVGRIQTGSYEGQDGKRVYTTDVVAESVQFLEPRSSHEGANSQSNTNYQAPQQNTTQGQYGSNNQQQNYSRVDEDPFANGAPNNYQVQEDDLPF